MWTILKPLDWLLEFIAMTTRPMRWLANKLRKPERKPAIFGHPAWLELTETGPLGSYVAPKGKDG